jgi:hypothetical protein
MLETEPERDSESDPRDREPARDKETDGVEEVDPDLDKLMESMDLARSMARRPSADFRCGGWMG